MVFEEDLPLDNEYHSTLNLPGGGGRDYGLIAQLYQQLKKNYDDHLDYWAADHFHYGEMEMQRLAVPTSGPFLKAWYRRGSSYGNSYLRPAAWLCGILLLFALLFPLTGLQRMSANTHGSVLACRHLHFRLALFLVNGDAQTERSTRG